MDWEPRVGEGVRDRSLRFPPGWWIALGIALGIASWGVVGLLALTLARALT
jgi:hypothetical protein